MECGDCTLYFACGMARDGTDCCIYWVCDGGEGHIDMRKADGSVYWVSNYVDPFDSGYLKYCDPDLYSGIVTITMTSGSGTTEEVCLESREIGCL